MHNIAHQTSNHWLLLYRQNNTTYSNGATKQRQTITKPIPFRNNLVQTNTIFQCNSLTVFLTHLP